LCTGPPTDRHAAGLESELRTLRQQQSDAGAAQVKVQQDLDVAKAEVARLQGQLGAAGRLQGQLDDLRSQLAQAAQRETGLQQQKAAAEQEAQQKAAQVRWRPRASGLQRGSCLGSLQRQGRRQAPVPFCRHQLHIFAEVAVVYREDADVHVCAPDVLSCSWRLLSRVLSGCSSR
jgi:hypothetical protein